MQKSIYPSSQLHIQITTGTLQQNQYRGGRPRGLGGAEGLGGQEGGPGGLHRGLGGPEGLGRYPYRGLGGLHGDSGGLGGNPKGGGGLVPNTSLDGGRSGGVYTTDGQGFTSGSIELEGPVVYVFTKVTIIIETCRKKSI